MIASQFWWVPDHHSDKNVHSGLQLYCPAIAVQIIMMVVINIIAADSHSSGIASVPQCIFRLGFLLSFANIFFDNFFPIYSICIDVQQFT